MNNYHLILCLLGLLCTSCGEATDRQFDRLSPEETGVNFVNRTGESDSFNILTNEYIYNGGGVGLGDFDLDGRTDIFFSGNDTDNQLYLNRGEWNFENITAIAGVAGSGRWSGGVTVVDVNGDGRQDIYVCASIRESDSLGRTNQLFLNEGVGADGIPRFRDAAPEYGIDNAGHNTQAAWLDYDLDGDLDLFLLVNKMVSSHRPNDFSRKVMDGSGSRTDKLFRQDRRGNQIRFVEVGRESGILYQGFALGATVCDFNRDGRPDLYVSNDYLSNDLAYLNTEGEDGQAYFVDVAPQMVKHTSYSAMGNDVVDLNNDGFPDILAVDMLPADNFRRKLMLQANNYTYLINLDRYGYQPQFVRNTLQISQGSRTDSLSDLPLYAESALAAKLPATDWSWTPLVADFDLDGRRDVIITNGFPRDITDHDFVDFNNASSRYFPVEKILPKIPSIKLKNEAFRATEIRDGVPFFERVSEDWGIDVTSFSNGAAYADLDNDGDLDYVVNNIDDPAHLYRNNTITATMPDELKNHFIAIAPARSLADELFFGAEVIVSYGASRQYAYWHPHRGYLSSHGRSLHFGIGQEETVDSILVRWPGTQEYERFGPVAANQRVELLPGMGARVSPSAISPPSEKPLLRAVNTDFFHEERDYIDFNVQPLLLKKVSQQGPALAVADVDGDGSEEVYVSGSYGFPGHLLSKNFKSEEAATISEAKVSTADVSSQAENSPEELGSLFFDADGDGDQDLFVVSGSYEINLSDGDYRHRFYRNEGGEFIETPSAIEGLPSFSGSCVRAADYDLDGDLDLFVGARLVPHNYPQPIPSYLLINESSGNELRFTIDKEGTSSISNATNVCDALFTDYDSDGRPDLLLAGEWAPLRLYRNTLSGWEEQTDALGLGNRLGWWNSLAAGDFDNDGDTDYLAGNYGLNNIFQPSATEPLSAILADVDGNDALDFIPFVYLEDEDGQRRPFTYHNRSDLAKQVNKVKADFTTHAAFSRAPLDYFEPPAGEPDVYRFSVNDLKSYYLENTPEGFQFRELPASVQLFPLFGMLPIDLNDDEWLDLLVIGNDMGPETGQGHANAGNGSVLLGRGDGTFDNLHPERSGFFVPGEGRSLVIRWDEQGPVILAAQNRGRLLAFRPEGDYRRVIITENSTLVPLAGGANRRVERYWGSGYLGQSAEGVPVRQ